jgi:hypothetical protein
VVTIDLDTLGRFLLGAGVALAVFGAALLVARRLGLGELPGDLHLRTGNVDVYVPLVTCVVLSVVATLILNLFRR